MFNKLKKEYKATFDRTSDDVHSIEIKESMTSRGNDCHRETHSPRRWIEIPLQIVLFGTK
jgi:hypothetical protein